MEEKATILVADDDPEVRETTVRALGKGNYRTLQAGSGEEALALAERETPDLLLLDFVMDDMNGDEVCRRIKSNPKLESIFVIILSGTKIESDDQAHGLSAGADGYIARPIGNRELLARIEAMLRIKRTQDALREALAQVRTLEGILPICMYCHSIRTDKLAWQKLESYLEAHSNVQFSHGMCPDCMKRLYPADYEAWMEEQRNDANKPESKTEDHR